MGNYQATTKPSCCSYQAIFGNYQAPSSHYQATTKPLLATTKPVPSPLWPLPSHYQAHFGHYHVTTKPPLATTKPLLATTKPPLAPVRVRVQGGDVRMMSRLLAAGHSQSWRWWWFFLCVYRCQLLSLCPACRRSACTGRRHKRRAFHQARIYKVAAIRSP